MKQTNNLPKENQVLFQGRWVSKEHFRTYMFSKEGHKKLVNTYYEYEKLLKTGEWKPEIWKLEDITLNYENRLKKNVSPFKGKLKHDDSNS